MGMTFSFFVCHGKKVLTENIISFKNQFDFYTDDLKKY